MGTVIEAVYDGEKFRPLKKVNLPREPRLKLLLEKQFGT